MTVARVALVTGGSRGIGRAVVERLADAGYSVVINYLNSGEAATDLIKYLPANVRALPVQADVSDHGSVVAMREKVAREFGRLDLLVNNAGQTLAGDWCTLEPTAWERVLQVNLTGVFNCIQIFAPLLSDSDQGRIVNISSVYAGIGTGFVAGYAAAKAAVPSLTRVFAKELAPRVLVNAVAPGDIDTEMTMAAGPEFISSTVEKTPIGRLGKPAEIAAVVAFLASRDAAFITGQTIVVDGGRTLGD
ncbi:SDR family NAD(P)-dependent oxidoreductase [Streptomyces sediminimaris]|uniref:SDR family NAD(P)-dependent oxidoreductase n=1 Tax=Streptomyces sediminimaris TaxID=3383721 RepID=UPI00399BF5BE